MDWTVLHRVGQGFYFLQPGSFSEDIGEAVMLIPSTGIKVYLVLIDIPIITMTAEAMKGDSGKCLKAGMNDYIPKPTKRDVVFKIIKKWCWEK